MVFQQSNTAASAHSGLTISHLAGGYGDTPYLDPNLDAVHKHTFRSENYDTIIYYPVLAGGGGLTGLGGTNNVNGTATASSVWNSLAAPRVFDNNTNTSWHSEPYSPRVAADQWIEFEFPYDVIITKYDICPRYNGAHANPLTWTLDGMVGATATTIHTSPTLVQNDWIPHTYKSFNVTDTTTAYDRIRLNINSAVNATYTNIGDIIYYGYRTETDQPITTYTNIPVCTYLFFIMRIY